MSQRERLSVYLSRMVEELEKELKDRTDRIEQYLICQAIDRLNEIIQEAQQDESVPL